jgi:hypothetical protein
MTTTTTRASINTVSIWNSWIGGRLTYDVNWTDDQGVAHSTLVDAKSAQEAEDKFWKEGHTPLGEGDADDQDFDDDDFDEPEPSDDFPMYLEYDEGNYSHMVDDPYDRNGW